MRLQVRARIVAAGHLPRTVERAKAKGMAVLALKALAHPSRLQIMDLLMGGVHCNCELAAQLGLAPNLLSYHLRLLEEAGLIASERDAQDGRATGSGPSRWRRRCGC